MWALYALLSAWSWATSDAVAKQAMRQGANDRFILFFRYLVTVPVLLPLLLHGVPPLDPVFWWLHLLWIPLETAALILYIQALRIAPLSLTLPYLSFTPLFLVLTGWVFLGERVSCQGFAGILLVVLGSYVLNLDRRDQGPWAPLRALLQEPGSRRMLGAAALYSLTSLVGKQLVLHSSPTYFSVHYAVVMTLVLAPIGLRHWPTRASKAPWPQLLASGVLFSGMVVFHMLAIERAIVAYMIALKRFQGVFGVILGRWVFHEEAFGVRLLGSLLMVLGGLLILGA